MGKVGQGKLTRTRVVRLPVRPEECHLATGGHLGRHVDGDVVGRVGLGPVVACYGIGLQFSHHAVC